MSTNNIYSSEIQNANFVHQLFEFTALAYPEAVAVTFGKQSINYRDLNKQADDLSVYLLSQTKGDEIIGISTTRSIGMIISLLAILKAGKAYLPLDPTYPEQRLKQIITDAGIKTCIAENDTADFFSALGLIVLRENNLPRSEGKYEIITKPQHLCFIYVRIYGNTKRCIYDS